jgi:hypothetical protein
MRVRITIEYDCDYDCDEDSFDQLAKEKQDWLDGNVGVPDIIGCDDPTMTVKFEEV